MKVAISGGLGFIGSRLAQAYASQGASISVLDNLHPQIHKDDRARHEVEKFARVIIGDVRDPAAWDNVLDGADLVLHMAAETGTGQSMDEIARYSDVNVGGTAILADAFARHPGISKVFLPSSRAIYGEGPYRCATHGVVLPERRSPQALRDGAFQPVCPACGEPAEPLPATEETEARPASIYATTKFTQELLLRQATEARGIALRVARYQNVFGPGQSLGNPYTGVLVIFAQQIAAGKLLDIYEDGAIARDFVYVDDVVDATVRIIAAEPDPGVTNVGSGSAATLLDVVRAFEDVFGRSIPYEITGHFRFGDIRYAVADTRRAARLGITARTGLADGIAAVVRWLREGENAAH